MTLRQALGGDARRIHDLVDRLLDSEDGMIVLADGHRVISYAEGFGLSPCQLELVTAEIERAVRAVGATAPARRTRRTRREDSAPRHGASGLTAYGLRRRTA